MVSRLFTLHRQLFLNLFCSDFSVDDRQTMEYNSSVKKLMLLVEVSNVPESGREAEDAHQAMLNITVPPSLTYSGFRSKVRTHRGALLQRSPHIFFTALLRYLEVIS